VRSALLTGYAELLSELKTRIRAAQVKAALAVNRELVQLYWQIGKSIVQRQQSEGWGSKVIDRLAEDLRVEFPGVAGFSRQNIYRMRALFLAYTGQALGAVQAIVSQAARQLDESYLPEPMASLPWFHNVLLIEKLGSPAERAWYAQQTVAHGWSRSVLSYHIGTGAFHRAGKAVTNFANTLPPPQSDLAQQIIKDPYNFDFLTLRPDAHERDLERGLVEHLKSFLLELGVGFAFVGQQYHLEVGGEDFYIDLLFYHLGLRRYVVIDLKAGVFRPEFAGKMNFYLSAVDDLLRRGDDQPSIGLILCQSRNRVIAEYALRDTAKPMGVATFDTNLPAALRDSLPSPAELARALDQASSGGSAPDNSDTV
jgi:predicted nuclease of restriction endonuclease-like (RecB) superfamily